MRTILEEVGVPTYDSWSKGARMAIERLERDYALATVALKLIVAKVDAAKDTCALGEVRAIASKALPDCGQWRPKRYIDPK